jgi:hypothetical protein
MLVSMQIIIWELNTTKTYVAGKQLNLKDNLVFMSCPRWSAFDTLALYILITCLCVVVACLATSCY